MASTKEDYLYFNPETKRWGATYTRGSTLRLTRTIVFSYSDFNYNAIERRVDERWEPIQANEYDALSRLEQGHQWTYKLIQADTGEITIHVTMARVADEVFAAFSKFKAKYVMTLNFTLDVSTEEWERQRTRAEAFGVDLIDLSVNMTEADDCYQEAVAEWERMDAMHQRAVNLAHDVCVENLLALEEITEDMRRASARYTSVRSRLMALHTDMQQEPGRLPEKAMLAVHVHELPPETPLAFVVALSKAAAAEQALVLRFATPRERQAALIASLLNDFFGARLVEARQDVLILYNGDKPAGIITKGQLEPYREMR